MTRSAAPDAHDQARYASAEPAELQGHELQAEGRDEKARPAATWSAFESLRQDDGKGIQAQAACCIRSAGGPPYEEEHEGGKGAAFRRMSLIGTCRCWPVLFYQERSA